MIKLSQSPRDPAFVQDPYSFYDRARTAAPLVFWQDYNMPAAFSHDAVSRLLKDRRFGREIIPEQRPHTPDHLRAFQRIEDHSMLEAEPPRHTRLRALVLRAFTSRRISRLAPDITTLCHHLIDRFPEGPFDLLETYCTPIPAITIARLLGVPEERVPDLLRWSHDMVAMYQATRTRETEDTANRAAADFHDYLGTLIAQRRVTPGSDLMSELITAEQTSDRLSAEELIATAILLLNAGHEATVHSLGNGLKCLLDHGLNPDWLSETQGPALIEELLRFDPPLHMFTRYAYESTEMFGYRFQRGDQVALVLGAANRDPQVWDTPNRFIASRTPRTNSAFGGGIHFCVGAPLARLEMQIALRVLFSRCPNLQLAEQPHYGDTYHFRGLTRLMVTA